MSTLMMTAFTTEILHNFTPLNALSEQRLKDVLAGCYIETLSPQTTLIQYGDCDDKAIFLLSGQLTLIDYHGNSTLLDALNEAANHAIIPSKPRQFTVVVHKTSNILAINQQKLQDALLWEQSLGSLAKTLFKQLPPNMDKDWVLRLLESHVFYGVPPLNILELLQALQAVNVKKGQKIIGLGEIADCCYFIKEGKAQVCQIIDGEYLSVAYLGKGAFFGEEGLLSNAPRNADVLMLEDGILMRLEKKHFDRLLKKPALQSMSFSLAQRRVEYQEAVWLDVRLAEEYQHRHIKSAIHLALPDIRLKARQLSPNQHYIVYCDNAQRSAAAAFLLGIQGYNTTVLMGGLEALTTQEIEQYLN